MTDLSRKIIPVKEYRRFDIDGWSKDIVVGLRIRKDGFIEDARLGSMLEGDEFYDVDGSGFRATHLMVLKRYDLLIGSTIRLRKRALWVPSDEQIKALSKAVKKLPWDETLKGLLKGLKMFVKK